MTAEELIAKAAACITCGNEHQHRWVTPDQVSWAADDGHPYRPAMSTSVVAQLRYLVTGTYTSPFQKPPRRRWEPA
jgi:hypothetical protein